HGSTASLLGKRPAHAPTAWAGRVVRPRVASWTFDPWFVGWHMLPQAESELSALRVLIPLFCCHAARCHKDFPAFSRSSGFLTAKRSHNLAQGRAAHPGKRRPPPRIYPEGVAQRGAGLVQPLRGR